MFKYYILLCILLTLYLISCSGSLPELTPEQINWASNRWPGTGLKELTEGRQLYISKCSGCHSLKIPSAYTEEEWQHLMKEMSEEAKLNDTEYEMIWQYVFTMSKR